MNAENIIRIHCLQEGVRMRRTYLKCLIIRAAHFCESDANDLAFIVYSIRNKLTNVWFLHCSML